MSRNKDAKPESQAADFESVKNRLAEIADAVADDELSLDDALDLYEEAVVLGLQASDLLETGIVPPDDSELAPDADPTGPTDSADASQSGDHVPEQPETPADGSTSAATAAAPTREAPSDQV